MNDALKCKQIKFVLKGSNDELGGIAIYLGNSRLWLVICAESGRFIDPYDIEIVKIYDDWVPFSEEIIEE